MKASSMTSHGVAGRAAGWRGNLCVYPKPPSHIQARLDYRCFDRVKRHAVGVSWLQQLLVGRKILRRWSLSHKASRSWHARGDTCQRAMFAAWVCRQRIFEASIATEGPPLVAPGPPTTLHLYVGRTCAAHLMDALPQLLPPQAAPSEWIAQCPIAKCARDLAFVCHRNPTQYHNALSHRYDFHHMRLRGTRDKRTRPDQRARAQGP